MLNNQYYKIYNESLLIIFDSLSDLLVKKEPFIENYTIYNNKKITDYMLFVRDFYKNPNEKNKEHTNIKNKSKYISILWKILDKKEKLIYKIKAKEMLEYFKKNYQNSKKIKKKEKEKEKNKMKKEDEKILFNKKRNNILKKIKIENVEYYIDCNNNLIDIVKEDYIGYLNDGIIHLFN
jgi:tRNA G10  N-methylase Trm11